MVVVNDVAVGARLLIAGGLTAAAIARAATPIRRATTVASE